MTFYRIRTKNLEKLMARHEVLYKRQEEWYISDGGELEVEIVLLRTLVVKRNAGGGTPAG